jgi:hypothetical protein
MHGLAGTALWFGKQVVAVLNLHTTGYEVLHLSLRERSTAGGRRVRVYGL